MFDNIKHIKLIVICSVIQFIENNSYIVYCNLKKLKIFFFLVQKFLK